MSEYQYYEFRAVDRPLDRAAMDSLREISSRAEITSTGLTNVYHYGSFKGKPLELMLEYFDAHVYVANWGSHRLMLRLPEGSFDAAAAAPYLVEHSVELTSEGDHVLDFHSHTEDAEDFEGGEGWMADLLPLRTDLMAGDLRALYLAWLSAALRGEVDEDAPEPPVPPGLAKLSGPLKRFAEFLHLDSSQLAAAATASGADAPTEPSAEEMSNWVAKLPWAEKNALIVRLMRGEGAVLAGELNRRFRTADVPKHKLTATGRTAGELLDAADQAAEAEQRRAAERAAAARERHLDSLAGTEEELWREVEASVALKQSKAYDRAIDLLRDLTALATRSGTDLSARMRQLRERHATKRTFIERLDKAGLRG